MVTIMSIEGAITADTNHQVQEGWCPYLHTRQFPEFGFFADAEFKTQTQDQKCSTLFSKHHFLWHPFQEYFHFGRAPKPHVLYIKLKLRSS